MALNFANNNSLSSITALPASISGGGLNLISTQTASGSANLSFTSGIDSTYKEYVFKFYNIHPATDNVQFLVNFSIDGGSNYNVTKTSTYFHAYNLESGGSEALGYFTSGDLAQSTSYQQIVNQVGNGSDESASGFMHLFDPSNTTFVKHFICTSNFYAYNNYTQNPFVAGYANTTSAINAVDFKMESGNMDSGVIKLYGIS
jgi:hypothetical protein